MSQLVCILISHSSLYTIASYTMILTPPRSLTYSAATAMASISRRVGFFIFMAEGKDDRKDNTASA
jgi:hypothetical protein